MNSHTVQDFDAKIVNKAPISLTELEVKGLCTTHNFADGHAAHDDNWIVEKLAADFPEIWKKSRSTSVIQMERDYRDSFAKLISSKGLQNHPYFSICPTASCSIDIVGAFLKEKKLKTILIEPTFDNLYLLLKRRGVDTVSLDEQVLRDQKLESFIQKKGAKALFLVNPNNPTGWSLDGLYFREILRICTKYGITLILDTTFRLFNPILYDDYQLLVESGIDFIILEDTGKVWPTQELKASLLAYSTSIASLMREIYEEVFLCVSNVTLLFLKNIFDLTLKHGIDETIRFPLLKRRKMFRAILQGTKLEIDSGSLNSQISVEWINLKQLLLSDMELLEFFHVHHVALLPGSLFYWENKEKGKGFVRLSLLKPIQAFEKGMEAFKNITKIL